MIDWTQPLAMGGKFERSSEAVKHDFLAQALP